ncbi:MAG TPA: ParB/RepB/Spo0J family partition protein, partial [Armatimonadota bacterium]|nr:ParB/RepB/Spo0J family partition protein [Armatimonadota bacterium]
LPLSRITRNPMNLRTTFDQASLEELAESLREVGMIDPLLVRPTPPARWGSMPGRQSGRDGWFIIDTTTRQGDGTFLAMEFYPNREIAESTLPRFELVDGERRYRASQLAELETVPVRVRELDDTAVLRIMFETAERRQSLNAVDRAEALVKLQELGVTQREIAEDLHVQQGTISRAMAVAQLPERVKEQGRQRQLSGSHLERLARFAHLPEVCVTLGELAAAQGASVRQLEQPVPFAQELQRANAILRLDYNTPFDHKTICPKCPFNAYRTVDQWTPVCLNPPHYRELAREAEAAKKAELEKARAAAAGGGKKLLQLRDLKYGTYEQISRQGCPPGCDEACACRAKAEAYGGDLVTICTDPKRYRKLQTAQAKAQKKGRQEVLARKIEHAGLLLSERQEIGSRELALPVYRSLGRVPVNGIRKALERAGVQLKADVFQFGYNQTGALDLLATLPPLVLARLAVEAEIAFDEVEVTAGHREQPQALDWYLGLGKSKKAAVPAEGENDAQ